MKKDTEMGDNDSIKTPQPCEANGRRARKQEKVASKYVSWLFGLAEDMF